MAQLQRLQKPARVREPSSFMAGSLEGGQEEQE